MSKHHTDSTVGGWSAPPTRAARAIALAVLLLGLGVLVVVGTYRTAYRHGLDDLRQSTQRQLQFLSSDLASALDKYDTLPVVLAGHPDLVALLRNADDSSRRDAVNVRLERLALRTHVAAIFLMDAQGRTLAASNWATSRSFVGQNYAFRPYFRDAIAAGSGSFYAVGATTGEPGYFLANRVVDDTQPSRRALGVVAVKISLDDIEANWQRSHALLMLADAEGVVFLSSRPEWKFRTLQPLSADTRSRINAAQQYGDSRLEPLQLVDGARDGVARLAVRDAADGPTRWMRVAAERRAIGHMGWTLLSFAEVDDVANLASGYAAAAGFACAFALVAALYARLRRRRDEERRRAKRELERANEQLEQRIGERTAVLVRANDELASKIRELDRTQATLRATQDELIQAGKLTVLGQMAASITHEINQPLAALRALNDNALMLLDRGDDTAVHGNLQTIGELTQRIAAIVGQLKGFARKDDLRHAPVAVAPAVAAAIAMVSADAKRHRVEIHTGAFDRALAVQGQTVRVEQILVNLLRNGVDACAENGGARIDIDARRDGDWVSISVVDTGAGIADEAVGRLFEPFFTTKPAGVGLGLGLAISGSIANALGGTLQAANRAGGGAVFTLRLPAAQWSESGNAAVQQTIG